MTPARLDPAELEAALADILRAAGCAPDIAAEVAEALVDADISGHDTHGSRQIDFYIERLQRGEVDGRARPAIESGSGSITRIAGNRAFGQITGVFAARIGTERARRDGVALVCLSGSGHLGRNGRWAELAAAAGVGSLHFGQGIPREGPVAPFGGREGRLNTNPIALGLPGPGASDPIILDCATSAVSGSTIKQAFDRGTLLDAPWLVTKEGAMTADPAAFMAGDAAVTTFGEFKGFAISVFSEIASTILATAGAVHPHTNSLFSVYFSVGQLMEEDRYRGQVAAFRDRVVSCPPLPGVDAVVMPGERSRQARARAQRDGLVITPDLARHLRRAADLVGIADRLAVRNQAPAPHGQEGVAR
ncbi:Ldh family oxidoreductase [Roseomonas sp. AR75]|uniref:Ldh family oxidoreductase n=1 Tax=Roseomonas sp. AR75 TaxID=2562311 RepID=UPI001484E953|nr:Ldh family oxidoreductase [Roseomonas sp. AR75]